jgi:SAM-dependent methyltransferase
VNKTADRHRLRIAPSFVLSHTLDGRPFVAKDVEPYTQFWVSERERVLLALFSARGGATVAEASAGYYRLTQAPATAAEQRRIDKALAGMRQAGVLIGADEDTSRYDRRIVANYVAHRPFPRPIVEHLVRRAAIGPHTRVLDLAGGPGDLALALARHSQQVSMMELSRAFLAAARRRARALGVPLQTLHDSCNRLVYRDEPYDLITVSQALHWLDDVMVCRGVCRLLQPGGSFFVIHSAMELPDAHPLAWLLGADSILGAKRRLAFASEVQPLQRRLSLLFEALDAPEVERVDPTHARLASTQRIAPAGVQIYRQTRPFDAGYARGFLTPQHIAITGRSALEFWAEVDTRCAAATPAQMLGTHHWAVLHYRRSAREGAADAVDAAAVIDISYEAPSPAAV